jgi:hypothetical protein
MPLRRRLAVPLALALALASAALAPAGAHANMPAQHGATAADPGPARSARPAEHLDAAPAPSAAPAARDDAAPDDAAPAPTSLAAGVAAAVGAFVLLHRRGGRPARPRLRAGARARGVRRVT